ncbi:hypothetical protein FQA39_LY17301 [Lamprigera yunnana]|nr:hypothetical protein FQA39_LY17301 [Lamprigera yunnana]
MSSLNVFDSSFDDISYTSKPLFTQDDEPRPSTSFDRIKETPNSSRKSSNYENSYVDIEEVKDYVKEQRIRSHMNEEDDEEVDNDFDNTNRNRSLLKRRSSLEQGNNKRVRFNVNEKENQKTSRINILPTGKMSPEIDHTKIISEVLKKYPSLVKKNKNIRLKILAKTDNGPSIPLSIDNNTKAKRFNTLMHKTQEDKSNDGLWRCEICSTANESIEFVLYYLYRKHMTDVHNGKFDSQMCKFCGHKCSKHNMLMYHLYTKHGVKPPPAYTFPKCSHCPYIALSETIMAKHEANHNKCVECNVTFTNEKVLTAHMRLTGHSGKTGKNNFDCQYCGKKFQSALTLFTHIKVIHRDEACRDGIVNMEDENEDVEYNEELKDSQEYMESEEFVDEMKDDKKDKIKILSDVKLSSMDLPQTNTDSLDQHNLALEPSSEAEALNNVASGIATSLGLVDVVVLDENQQYILHTDNQQSISSGESQFILPDLQDTRAFTTTQQVITSEQNVITQSMLHNSDIASTDELVMVLTDHDYDDGNNEIMNTENANIVVLYSHPIEGQENQFLTSQGNIMLTSQAGLVELRNSNSVVTSAGSHYINAANESAENTPIESIEMIQREINQHSDIQDIKSSLDQNISADTDNPSLSEEMIIITDSQPPNESFDQESVQLVENEVTRIIKNADTQISENQAVESIENQVVPLVENESVQSVANENALCTEDNIDKNIENIKNKAKEDNSDITEKSNEIDQSHNEEEMNKENKDQAINDCGAILNVENENIQKKSEEHNHIENNESNVIGSKCIEEVTKDPVSNLNTYEEEPGEVKNINLHLRATPEISKPKEIKGVEKIDDINVELIEDSLKNNDDQVKISQEQDNVPNILQASKTTEEKENVPKISQISETTKEKESNYVQVPKDIMATKNFDVLSEDDASQESLSLLQNCENKKQTHNSFSQEQTDKSARIILEDWEDTDSQQSNPKPSANVNKLIDDWDDDEDDKKS